MWLKFLASKPFLILGALAAFIVVLWFWRGEIYRAAENLVTAQINEQTITIQEQSKKETESVRKEIQSFDDIQLDNRLCDLGIVQDNGCEGD